MKKTRFTILLISILLFPFSFVTEAEGFSNDSIYQEHKIIKGENPYLIAKKYLPAGASKGNIGALAREICRVSGIKDPRRISIGTVLLIPVEKVKGENFMEYSEDDIGSDPFRGTLLEALKLMKMVPKETEDSDVKIERVGERGEYSLRRGDKITMVSGRDKVGRYIMAINSQNLIACDVFKLYLKGKLLDERVYRNIWCNNWLRIVQSKPVTETTSAKEPSKVVKSCESSEIKTKVLIPEDQVCLPKLEPILGAGFGRNNLSKWQFYYAEGLIWFQEPFLECGSEYSLGLGFYMNAEKGESLTSDYEWEAFGLGGQIGIERVYPYLNEKGIPMFRQWKLKLRGIWETQEGENAVSGYRMDQDNFKVGPYGEYQNQFSEKWMFIVIGEAWFTLDKEKSSTWAGDIAESRDSYSIGAYLQYKVNDHCQLRFGGGFFYQGWDDLLGLHLRMELRFWEILMIGPYVNIPLNRPDVYNFSRSDLTSWGGFVRVELWKPAQEGVSYLLGSRVIDPENEKKDSPVLVEASNANDSSYENQDNFREICDNLKI